MRFSDDILKNSEIAVFRLRELFREYGYTRFDMSKFEEYELYASNKPFIGSDDIITFTDAGGRLKALRPDVTLSIVKNTKSAANGIQRLYYNENVYRRAGHGREFKERMQSGLECIGDIGTEEMSEVLALASKSLSALTPRSCIDISHMGFLGGLLDGMELPSDSRAELLRRISEKNAPEVQKLAREYGIDRESADRLCVLTTLYGPFESVYRDLEALIVNDATAAAAAELKSVIESAKKLCPGADLRIDFSVAGDMSYYDGIIFQGYAEGIPAAILSGGRYDSLMRKFGRRQGAIGFAVYIDLLERAEDIDDTTADAGFLNIALPKGRLGETVYAIFEKAGYGCADILGDSRKLVFENAQAGVRYFWVKPSDVAIYVERGAADIGVCGSDIIMDGSPDVYELADLGVGKCRLAVAAPREFEDRHSGVLRVATKFVNIARNYYAGQNREIDVIQLNGSIELAPLLGLSDVIVDIVETGATLRENGLEVKEEIGDVSARLIANKAGFKFKHAAIARLAASVGSNDD
ncbi:MAG: ATP phosphoribosyltransferase [Oscillospiraceae bacterium]|jgi:ATP phosphoribosyltransferase regulatory subunit|nr:ATP phosphoribosyltransferase [Oscillospiraceae bacterium]